jgi:hypothetical protein
MKIYLDFDYYGKRISINVKENDTIKEVKKKAGYNHLIFLYKAKVLQDDKTIEYYRIKEDDIIKCIDVDNIIGGEVGNAAKGLADPTKKGPVRYQTTTDGPDYLTVSNGINLFGPCKNKHCIAYNKEVCSMFGFGTFDLIKDLDPDNENCPKCPSCEFPLIKLETCGFKKCKYSYIGTKIDDKEKSKLVPVNYSNSISEAHKLDYFEAGKSGEYKSLWTELKITAYHL